MFLVHHLSPFTNSFLNCVHGIRVNSQHENEAIGSKGFSLTPEDFTC